MTDICIMFCGNFYVNLLFQNNVIIQENHIEFVGASLIASNNIF